MKSVSLSAIASVAYKEFLHIYRDRRVLVLLLILPPLFTLIFGHAFEASELTNVPALLINRDNTPRTQRFIDIVLKNKTFCWKQAPPETPGESDCQRLGLEQPEAFVLVEEFEPFVDHGYHHGRPAQPPAGPNGLSLADGQRVGCPLRRDQ